MTSQPIKKFYLDFVSDIELLSPNMKDLITKDYCFLHIPIEPTPKGRPRMTRSGHVYTPSKTRDYETAVKLLVNAKINKYSYFPYEGPVTVRFVFFLAKAKTRKDIHHVIKPDIDNLIKSTLDAIVGSLLVSDTAVVEIDSSKYYIDNGKPRFNLKISKI